jgi:hypothetical protein
MEFLENLEFFATYKILLVLFGLAILELPFYLDSFLPTRFRCPWYC